MSEWFKRYWTDVLAVVALLAVIVAVFNTQLQREVPKSAAVAPEVASVPKEEIPLKGLTVYAKPAKSKLGKAGAIPEAVVKDDRQSVVAASRVASSERPQTVTTTVNAETGVSDTYVVAAPRPWLATESRGELSLDYGYKRNALAPVGRINIRQDVLQIKALHLGLSASGYSDGDYFVGAGVSYRW